MGMTKLYCDNGSYDFCVNNKRSVDKKPISVQRWWWNHCPRYHHGLSRHEHIEQVTGSRFLAWYGPWHSRYNRMRCYGRPSGWCWSVKDKFDGPASRNHKRLINRLMRKRARRENKRLILEEQLDAQNIQK